jgi:DNA-binding CsgD family transcriptional regulator
LIIILFPARKRVEAMTRSQNLSQNTIRSIYRLVHEVCEIGDDAHAWRRHMLAELGRLTGSKSIRCVVVKSPVDVSHMQLHVSVDWGLDADELTGWRKYLATGDFSDSPVAPAVLKIVHRSYVRTREQLCDDHAWYRSQYFNKFRRPLRSDHLMNCSIALPWTGTASVTSFSRALGDKPFTGQEMLIAGLFHSELRRIWRKPSPDVLAETLAFTPRQQQILELMANGAAEKQIAQALGLSRHTVHNYIRAMYRKSSVTTRAGLLAIALPSPGFRPRILPR